MVCGKLDWGVTVNGKLVYTAALHPKYREVGICPDSCLEVGH